MKFELKPYNLNATDEDLLADLKKVAKELNKQTLTQREYTESEQNRFNGGTIANRFGGWNEALKKADLEILFVCNVSDEELIEDLKRVAEKITPEKVTQKKYNQLGKYTPQTISERFGWNKALKKIGAEISVQQNITDEELFENLESVWIKLGHQPGKREMIKPFSKCSEGPYINKYGTWRKALEAFVEYINSDVEENQKMEESNSDSIQEKEIVYKHKTKRNLSERLKVQVLMKDGNKCKLCGITVTGENIHFDHVKPWSKGGETVLENIQVLCAKHNLAKGNLEISE